VPLTRATLLYLKTFTLKRISQPLSMALPLLSGVLSLLSRLRDLLHLLLVRLVGIALWLRLEIRACRPSLSILMSSARVSAHLLNMLLSAQRARARSLLGLMVSLHDPPPTALARLVLLALPHLVQALCAVACHRRQRRIMWRPARTIPNRHNLLLSLLRHNSRRPLPTRRSHLSSRSQPAFLTPTMARMLALPASHRLHRHHLLGWPDLLVRRPLALSHLTDAQAAHLQKYQTQHHADPSASGGIASGAPAPAAALAAAEAAARDREDRPPTAPPKRHREWEESPKLQSNDEKRQKLEEPHSRRPSPPHHASSPQIPRQSPQVNSDARRINDGYHPSEAAHHPPSLAPIGAPQAQTPLPRMSETPAPAKETPRPEHHEPAARHVDVDENYDDEGDEPKTNGTKSERNSPRPTPTNGVPHPVTPAEQKP
jgi:hypothetical protein